MHYFEEKYYPDIYLTENIEEYNCTDFTNHTFKIYTKRHKKIERNFLKFQNLLTKSDKLKFIELNGIKLCSFKAKDLAFIMNEQFIINPFSTVSNCD
jgi:hypothetical protein